MLSSTEIMVLIPEDFTDVSSPFKIMAYFQNQNQGVSESVQNSGS